MHKTACISEWKKTNIGFWDKAPTGNREHSHIRIIPGRCTKEAGEVRESDSLDVAGTK